MSSDAGYLLYYSPGAASMAVHWALLHANLPFDTELVDIDQGAQHEPAYRRLNPTGRVPTLIVDGKPRTESAALLMLLAERHPEAHLAPAADAPARAEWFETMIWLANTVLPAMRDWFYAGIDGDAQGEAAVRALARKRIEAACAQLDARLSDGRQYLVGGALSTVDLLAVVLMRWTRNMPRPATDWPRLSHYIVRMRSLPSFAALHQREGLTGWVNA